jgi:hypothetical protein
MAANSLEAIIPQLLTEGIRILRQKTTALQIVNRGYESLAGRQGDTIQIPVPSAIAAANVTPSNTPPQADGFTPTTVDIKLDQWKKAEFYLTDKEELEIQNGFLPKQAEAAVVALADTINTYIYGFYKKFYGNVGTAGTTPFGATPNITDLVHVRRLMNTQLAPMDRRALVLDPDAEANALALAQFHNAQFANDATPMIEGTIDRRMGFNLFMQQNMPTHTAGTAAAATVTEISNSAAGVKTVTLKVAAGTATLVEGDLITFAGHTQQYVVTTGVTLDTTGVSVAIEPGLKVAVNGSGTPVAVTVKASHAVNLGLHADAIGFATRPLVTNSAQARSLGSIIVPTVDPQSGLTLRLEVTRQYKQTMYSYDVLYGANVIRREFGVRLLG